jgi:hypothetical protein
MHEAQLHSVLRGALVVGWMFSLVPPEQVYLQDPIDPGLGASVDALDQTKISHPCHESNHNSSSIKPVV